MIKIIGIDPGLSATGIGIVRGIGSTIKGYSFGSINTSKNNSLPDRLDHIYSKLLQILKDENPDVMVMEDVFSLGKYPKSGIALGQVSGVETAAGRSRATSLAASDTDKTLSRIRRAGVGPDWSLPLSEISKLIAYS